MIYRGKFSSVIDRPTDGPTDRPTDGQTFAFLESRHFHWTGLKSTFWLTIRNKALFLPPEGLALKRPPLYEIGLFQ